MSHKSICSSMFQHPKQSYDNHTQLGEYNTQWVGRKQEYVPCHQLCVQDSVLARYTYWRSWLAISNAHAQFCWYYCLCGGLLFLMPLVTRMAERLEKHWRNLFRNSDILDEFPAVERFFFFPPSNFRCISTPPVEFFQELWNFKLGTGGTFSGTSADFMCVYYWINLFRNLGTLDILSAMEFQLRELREKLFRHVITSRNIRCFHQWNRFRNSDHLGLFLLEEPFQEHRKLYVVSNG